MTTRTRVLDTAESDIQETLNEAAAIINRGGLVAFPTETVYGLGADALDAKAVRAIFEAKGRPADNPLIVHVASKEQCSALARNIPGKAFALMDEFWPGPLTLILDRTEIVPDVTTGGLDTVALRMPDNEIALGLIMVSGKPLAAPSANLSGKPSPTNARHVIEDLADRIDAVIDGGNVKVGLESTVIDMTLEVPAILRPGGISREDIERVIGAVVIGYEDKVHSGSAVVRSPGMKYTHYAPDAAVTLIEGEHEMVISRIQELLEDSPSGQLRIGLLLTDEGNKMISHADQLALGSKDSPGEIALNLFSGLRYLDSKGVDLILVDGSFSHLGIGAAVSNRIRKAASTIIKV
ncbi:L-threonylcarbamoyladenylate synthase [Methanolobus chelungpuianus]|uniref:Threonylcarbamoyl-AMP synthase n=1 Tax=Methanolobus chelungpuianus TaxID=502115 RepID=A0AAE3HB47_9EURY|nr:L-threonylcarbamoyladenylate synthase [Methanolobus chelungpuianus]MCQ6963106.1 tRNA threonylcarbamoyladenosine biosynthesis protein [Methanolobus chelungpuianus]